MLQIVRHNFLLKALSLSLAIVGWAYFRFIGNAILPPFEQHMNVPITAANLPPGLIATYADKTAAVAILPKAGEPSIKPEEIKAVLDLSNRNAGVYNVPVQLVAPNVVVQSLSPASVSLTISKMDQRTFPLAIHYGGQGNVVVSRFTLTPSSAVVRGPTEALAQVATVRIDIQLGNGKARLDAMIRPMAVNSAGQEISDVQVVPNLVRVQAQFLPGTASAHGR
jgi:YbbR domain-containing protein